MRNIVGRTLAVLALIVGGLVVAAPAQAAECHAGVLCGKFYNVQASTGAFHAGQGWNGTHPTGTIAWIAPGHRSTEHIADTDALFASCPFTIGGRTYSANRWHKIGDSLWERSVQVRC